MTALVRILAACSVAGMMAGAAAGACPDLPSAGSPVPVLVFDVVDADAPRDPPLLGIDSDGGVTVRLHDGLRHGEMTRDALAGLLRRIVVEAELAGIDGAAIREAISRPPEGASAQGSVALGGVVMDAPTSFLRVDLPDCRFDLSVFGSAHFSRLRPDVAPLQRFREIELELLEIVVRLQTG